MLIPESREVARLMLENVHGEAWNRAVKVENVLQKRSPESAWRISQYIKKRLGLMKPGLWKLVYAGSSTVTAHALLASGIKQSRLLGDFMILVLKEKWLTFDNIISPKDWSHFMELCIQKDDHAAAWSEKTVRKLRQVTFRILVEAKYIDSASSPRLLPVMIEPEVREYLVENSEDYVIRAMEMGR